MRRARRPDIAVDGSRANVAARTGTEWYSYELIRAMIRIEDRRPLTIYHRDKTTALPPGGRVRHRVIHVPRLWTHAGLSYAIMRDRPAALFVPSHVIPAYHPATSIVTIHDLGYLVEQHAHTARSRIVLDLTTRWNAAVAARIIAISGQTRDDLIHHYGVDPTNITVVLSGVNHDRFRPLDRGMVQRRLAELGIERPYLLFLGTVQPRKNLHRLLDAFEMLDDPGALLVVAGKPGWKSDAIEERIATIAQNGSVLRLGYVSDNDVPILYNGAQAFVLPSLYEGFGMPLLEAMACGCPVVTSNRSSLPEVAGGAAILVDPGDSMSIRDGIRRALDAEAKAELAEAGLRRASTFTWDHTARETLQVIHGAIDES